MTQRLSALAIAAGLTLFGLPVAQAATTQLSLTDFSFSLVDLTPDDDIAPWIRYFGVFSPAMSADVRSSINQQFERARDGTGASAAPGHLLADMMLAVSVPGAAMSGITTPASLQLSAEASVHPAGHHTDMSIANFRVSASRSFELAPNTAIVLRGQYAIQSDTETRSGSGNGPGEGPYEYGSGMLLIEGYLPGPNNMHRLEHGFGLSNFDSRGRPSHSASGSFEYTLTNAAAESAFGFMLVYAAGELASFTRAQPIPEPQTAGLILAGLAGLGVSAWRRRA